MSWSPSTMRWGKKKVHISCNKLDALLPPQEAIVTHWITVVVGSSATHLLKLCRINLLPTIAYKKEKIKLDPPVSAAGASPLWRDSMTHWPSSWHSSTTRSLSSFHYRSHVLLNQVDHQAWCLCYFTCLCTCWWQQMMQLWCTELARWNCET